MISEKPYPGLRPFRQEEIEIFFGREDLVDDLLEHLEQSRFLSVVGSSGAGKSSLVYAGLLGALKNGFMGSAGSRWHVADMRPGNSPILRLADALLKISGQKRYNYDNDFLKTSLQRGRNSFSKYLEKEQWLTKDDNLLILVDQFEELFRYEKRRGQEEAEIFVDLLLGAVRQKKHNIYVIITMRSEFIGDCARFEGLPETINDSQFLTPRLTREQLEEAIERPAKLFGGNIEETLKNTLLNDMGTNPDQLPLMQHALMRMWGNAKQRQGEQAPLLITLEDYEAVDYLKGALSQHADEAYKELSKKEQLVAETMFRLLTEPRTDRKARRRPASFESIVKVVAGGETTETVRKEVKDVAAVFREEDRSFLMPPPAMELSNTIVLDISHESLIRHWKTLNKWVAEEADSAEIYKRLERDAQDWKGDGTGFRETPRLDIELQWRQEKKPTVAWAERYGGDFSLAMEFLDASEKKREEDQRKVEKAQQKAEKARQRELEQANALAEEQEKRAEEQQKLAESEKQNVKRFRRLTLVLAILVIAAIGAGIYAFNQQKIAKEALALEEKARTKAELAEKEAKISKDQAEDALAEAEKSKLETEKALTEAEKSQKETKEALAEAEKSRENAEKSKKETEDALAKAEKSQKETARALALAEKLREEAIAARIETEDALAKAEKSQKETARAIAEAEKSKEETERALSAAKQSKKEAELAQESLNVALKNAGQAQTKAEKAEKEAKAARKQAVEAKKQTDEALALAEKSKKEAEAAQKDLQKAQEKEQAAKIQAGLAEEIARNAKQQAEIAEKQAEEAEEAKKRAEAALTTTEESKKELEVARDSLIDALQKEEASRIQAEEAERLAEAAKDQALSAKKLVEDALTQTEKLRIEAERARDALAVVLRKEEEARKQAEHAKQEAQKARDIAIEANERTERALALAEKSKKETEEALALAEKSKKETEEALALAEKLREEAERARDSLRVALRNEEEARTKAEEAEKEADAARDQAVEAKKQAEEALALSEKSQKEAEEARKNLQKAQEKEQAAKIQVGLAEAAAKTANEQAEIAKKQAEEAKQAQERAEAALTTTEESKRELEVARDFLQKALKKEETARIQAEEAEKLAEAAKNDALNAKKQVENALDETEKLKKEAERARDAFAAVLKKEEEARVQAELAKREAQVARDIAIRANEKIEDALDLAEKSKKATQKALILAKRSKEEAEKAREEARATEKQRTLDLFESQLTHASLLAEAEDYAEAKTILAKSRQLDESIPLPRRHARNLLIWFTKLMGSGPEINFEMVGTSFQKIEISPDGRWLAAAGEQGAVIIYDRESGEVFKQFDGHHKDVRGLVFHPKGHKLYSGGLDQSILSWLFPEGEILDEWQIFSDIESLAISSDGGILASGAFSGKVVLWNTQTGEELRTLEEHKKSIAPHNGLAFSSVDKLLGSASYDGTARIWDLATNQNKLLNSQNKIVDGIAFHPSGRLVATALDDNTIRLWDVETAKMTKVLDGHQNSVFGLQFTLSGDQLISTSRDRTLRIWDTKSGVTLHVLQGHTAAISTVSLAQDLIYSASSDGAIKSWQDNSTEFMQIVDLEQEPGAVAISTDGTKLVVGFANGDLWLYSLLHKEVLWKKREAHNERIMRIAFNPDGQLFATGSLDTMVKLWSIEGEQKLLQTLVGHKDIVHDVAFSPDGQTIATASYDGQIGLFQWKEDKNPFFEAYDGERVFSVDFDNIGTHLISSGNDQQIRIWNLAENPPTLSQAITQPQGSVTWASISPDGQFVASAGQDQIVSLYSITDKEKYFDLVGHENTVFRAIFSPDSQQLATASADATIRLWDLETGRELFVLPLPIDRNESSNPLWDFDFHCADLPTEEGVGHCWIAVPLTSGRLVMYDLNSPY